MKYLLMPFVLLVGLIISCQQNKKEKTTSIPDKAANEITLYTKDSIQIFGDLYEKNKTAPTILLFHQGGSNARAEYQTIIPILEKNGFNILAIDQRIGGQFYGNYNRTVANIPINEFEYCEAYADLESALDFILNSGFTGKKILWGSSYSGSLAIKLANQYQSDINGVLVFSPASGGPMQACKPDEYFSTLKIPLLVLRPKQEMEIESSKNQFELAKENNHEVYIADYGTHGSSMLVEERVGHKIDQNWNAVLSFLKKIKDN
jgi:pimeloyl-ACP methyl ester carboxylesterase